MRLYGKIEWGDFADDSYFSDNKIDFIGEDKNHNKFNLDDDHLKSWAIGLNSPWGQADMSYIIELNCKDSFTEMDKNEPKWRCIYKTIGYDMLETSCIGYGDTAAEAFEDCKQFLEYLQKKYNPSGDSI